jgi:arylsulfatase A-like enzyme
MRRSLKGEKRKVSKQVKPDILLIVLDTLRADRLSCYGYPRETSPHIDAFAESGVLFERAISPAQWTIPAHASLFTGEYPTTHMTTQIYDKHSKDQIMLAEVLHREGYLTVGFCDNPLLGIVENDLDRGFEEFYNYCGTLPNRPAIADARPRRLGQLAQRLLRLMGRLTTPIQDLFARNSLLLRIALHPRVVPLWQRLVNFKGNTAQSLRDVVGYLRTRQRKDSERPLFIFINLMETHLPYRPPPRFIRQFAPYYKQNREARHFMQNYNLEHYGWMIPLMEPLTGLQDRVINDLYDTEVAYEDHLLRRLFAHLSEPEIRDNTLVVITSDHGEGLNHHNFVGHSLVAYDDLVHVPLIVRYPRCYPAGKHVSAPVSTRRVFHTVLEAAGAYPASNGAGKVQGAPVDVEGLSLARALRGPDPEAGIVFTEAYTPETLITLMESENREAIETFRCRLMRRAAYRSNYKLITVGDEPDELFDVINDPGELDNLIGEKPEVMAELNELLIAFLAEVEARRPANWEASRLCLDEDEEFLERLRGLGYIE